MTTMQAKKLANYFSLAELLVLLIGGIIIACYMMNKSLIFLILVTVAWIVVIIVENAALSFNSYCFLVVVGVFRMICLTAVCIVPITLASSYGRQDLSGIYFAVFGGIGVFYNPIKGVIILKAARNVKNRRSNEYWEPQTPAHHHHHADVSQKSEVL